MPGISYSIGLDAKSYIEGMKQVTRTTSETDGVVRMKFQAMQHAATELGATVALLKKVYPEAAEHIVRLQSAVDKQAAAQVKAATSTRNTGQAMLTTGRAVQDLQFGIAGVLNNIEGLVVALGGTAGLAGVLTLVGVGISMLLPLLRSQADESANAAAETRKLAIDADNAAESLRKEAASFGASEAAAAKYRQRMAELETAHDKANSVLQQRQKLLEATKTAELSLMDAQADKDIAQVEESRQRGVIDDQEAERRKAKINADRDAARQKGEAEIQTGRIAVARGQANAARVKAGRLAVLDTNELQAGAGLLNSKDRALAEADKAAGEAGVKAANTREEMARKKIEELESNYGPAGRNGNRGPDITAEVEELKRQIAVAKKEREESSALWRTAADKLREDKAARERTGLGSREELNSRHAERTRDIESLNNKTAEAQTEVEAMKVQRAAAEKAAGIKAQTAAQITGTKVLSLDQRDFDERNRAKIEADLKQEDDKAKAAATDPQSFSFAPAPPPRRASMRQNTAQFRAAHGDGGMRNQFSGLNSGWLYGRAPSGAALDAHTGRAQERLAKEGEAAGGQRKAEAADQGQQRRDAVLKKLLSEVSDIKNSLKNTRAPSQ